MRKRYTGPPKPKAIFRLANALARRHLGVRSIFSVRERVRRQLMGAAKAALAGKPLPCGRCRERRAVDPGHAVVFQGRLIFPCRDCYGPVERHLESPVVWNLQGV
jgi:hypothetical protein